jgi:hypothetical protein
MTLPHAWQETPAHVEQRRPHDDGVRPRQPSRLAIITPTRFTGRKNPCDEGSDRNRLFRCRQNGSRGQIYNERVRAVCDKEKDVSQHLRTAEQNIAYYERRHQRRRRLSH